MWIEFHKNGVRLSRYTYRCVALPDADDMITVTFLLPSQCTYRCVVLPDFHCQTVRGNCRQSQCTYRCVVLPDEKAPTSTFSGTRLNAPTGAWCSLTQQSCWQCTSLSSCLNAPTGAWCSLTPALGSGGMTPLRGPGAPPAPGAPLRTGQHRAQSST